MANNTIDSIVNSLADVLIAKKNLILQGAPGTGKTFIAKEIAKKLIGLDYEKSEQYKIVQFHPSYAYEDFVRGIIATTDNEGNLTYTPTNKILAEFAKEAYNNYIDSQKESLAVNKQNWVKKQLLEYKDHLQQDIQNSKDVKIGKYSLNAVNRSNIEVDSYSIPDTLVTEAYIAKEIDKDKAFAPKYFGKATWTIVDKFNEYLKNCNKTYVVPKLPEDKIPLKNFIIIIDEINRANLPMVLGELIYALEYRGSEIETLYNVEGDKNIILPPNLYIIGTMNTADRSASHIDYAIRRRFAFEYIEARSLKTEKLTDGAKFDDRLFNKVQSLFNHKTWLSEEFDKRDVAIGHSYFITHANSTNGMSREMRIKYEIRPLLEEYVKDGILKREYGNCQISKELDNILK